MNLRNWSRQHTFGLLLGIITTIVFVPVIKLVFELTGNHQAWFLADIKSKLISLASIANLGWFHLFMKEKKFDLGMGVILATFINLFVILYLKFL